MKQVNKLFLLVFMTLISFLGSVYSAETEVLEVGYPVSTVIAPTGSIYWVAENFSIINGTQQINAITIPLREDGTAPASVVVRIETVSGSDPSGTLVNANSTVTIPLNNISSTLSNVTANFLGNFTLINDTEYFMVTRLSWSSASDRTLSGVNTANVFPRGLRHTSTNSGSSWIETATQDMSFKLLFFSTPLAPTITTDIQPFYNSSSISIQLNTTSNTNMSYFLDADPEVSICNECNNSLLNLTSLSEGFHDIIFSSTNDDGQVNTTANFTIDTVNPSITNNLPAEINSYFLDFNGTTCTDTNIDTCTLNIESTNYDLLTVSNATLTINGNSSYTITAIDLAGNNATETGVILVNPTQYFQAQLSNGTNVQNFTLEGRASVGDYVTYLTYGDGLVLGSNTLLFEKLGFVSQNVTFTLNTTSDLNLTINVSQASITVNLYDRTTGNLLNQSADVQIVTLANGTTSNGTITFTDINFVPGTYVAQAISDNYYTEQKTFTYSGEANVVVDLYLLSTLLNNSASLVTPITDEWDNLLENANVRLLEYDNSIFGFKEVSSCISNSNGECKFLIEVGTKKYIVMANKVINGVDYLGVSSEEGEFFFFDVSGGQELLGTIFIRNVRLKPVSTLFQPSSVGLFITSPDYLDTIISSNSTNTVINIPISYLADNGLSYTVCAEYYRIDQNNLSKIITNICDTGSSGIVPAQNVILDNDFSYEVRITVEFDGDKYTYRSYLYFSTTSFMQILLNDGFAPNIVIFFWVLLLTISLWLKAINIWVYGAFSLSILQLVMFPNFLIASSSVSIILINIGVLYVSSKQVDSQ